MLGKPYELIHKEGTTNYYFLTVGKEAYIAVENFLVIDGGEELTVSVYQLPVVAGIMAVLGLFSNVKQANEVKDEEGEVIERIFEVIDIKYVRTQLAEAIANMTKTVEGFRSKFDFESNPRSEILNTFRYDGKYQTLMVEDLNTRVRNTWMVKSTANGILVLHSLITVGSAKKHEHLTMMSSFMLSIETAKAIVDFIKEKTTKIKEDELEEITPVEVK